MTTVAPPAHPTRAAAAASTTSARLSFGRVVRSEFLKLFTLRSTWWTLAFAAALTVGLAALIAGASSSFGPGLSPVAAITLPIQFTMLVAGILGAMAITGEYSTGMIRSTLTAEPRRGRILLAKSVVVAATLALLAAVTTVVAGLVVMPILGVDAYAWGDAKELWLPLLLSLLAMATFGLLGLGWGFVIRNGAGAIATTVGVLFVLPIVLQLFMMFGESWQWVVDLGRWLPSNATAALTDLDGADFWPSLVATIVWPVGALLLGWGVLRTRDA
ncbi:ABC transporter permease [Microbacterium sp. NPDC077663]|uniref:ABC transporter permease n=1 Tax=Microbacterium sp. NPDC077663 TaxID=3364189 RepID=UPI0037C8A56A